MINIKMRCVKANASHMATWCTVLYLFSILFFSKRNTSSANTTRKTSYSKKSRVFSLKCLTVKLPKASNWSKRSVHHVLLFIQYILSPDHITHMKYLHNRGLPLIHWLPRSRIILAAIKVLLMTFVFALLNYNTVLRRAGRSERKAL